MKRNIILSLLLATITMNVFAQNSLDNFIHKYKNTGNVTYVRLGGLLMQPFLAFDKDARQAHLKIHSLEVLVLEDDAPQQKNARLEIPQLQSNLIKEGYNEWLYVRSDGDKVHILGKQASDNIIKDCVLLVNDSDNETVVLHLKGNLNLNDVINDFGKGNLGVHIN